MTNDRFMDKKPGTDAGESNMLDQYGPNSILDIIDILSIIMYTKQYSYAYRPAHLHVQHREHFRCTTNQHYQTGILSMVHYSTLLVTSWVGQCSMWFWGLALQDVKLGGEDV